MSRYSSPLPHPEDEIVPAELVHGPVPVATIVHRTYVRPVRPPIWPIFVVLLLSIGVQLMGAAVMAFLAVARHPEALRSPAALRSAFEEGLVAGENILVSGAMTMLGFAVLAVAATWIEGERLRDRLRLTRPNASPGLLVLALAGVLSLQLAFMSALQLEYLPQSEVIEDLFRNINALNHSGRLAAIFVFGVAPGICEEILFRGYVQTGFSRRWGPWRGALVAGFIFGLMHMNLVQGLFATLLGLYLGLLTERTGSVIPAIILHGTNNVLATILALGNWDPEIPRPELILALAFAVFVLTEFVIAKPIVTAETSRMRGPSPSPMASAG